MSITHDDKYIYDKYKGVPQRKLYVKRTLLLLVTVDQSSGVPESERTGGEDPPPTPPSCMGYRNLVSILEQTIWNKNLNVCSTNTISVDRFRKLTPVDTLKPCLCFLSEVLEASCNLGFTILSSGLKVTQLCLRMYMVDSDYRRLLLLLLHNKSL